MRADFVSFAGVLFGVVVLAWTGPAAAYRRATVDGEADRGLYWAERTIGVEVGQGAGDPGAIDLHAAIGRSLATWAAPDCSDVRLFDAGDAGSLSTNLVDGRWDGVNRVVTRAEGWPVDVDPMTLALTTLVYDRTTGRVLDADIDLNLATHAFATSEVPPSGSDDVENTVTHETGHLLGLAHAVDPEATMFASADVGETSKRDLAADDVNALCETYPTGAPTPALSSPAPTCQAGTTRGSSPGAVLAGGVAAVVSARSARRSRRRARAGGRASEANRR